MKVNIKHNNSLMAVVVFILSLLVISCVAIAKDTDVAKAVKSPTWPVTAVDNDISITVYKPGKIVKDQNIVQLCMRSEPHTNLAAGTIIGANQFLAANFYAWTDPETVDGKSAIIQFEQMKFNAGALQSKWNLPNGAEAMFYFEYADGGVCAVKGTFNNGYVMFDASTPGLRNTMWTRCSIVMDKQYEPKPVPPGPDPTPGPDVTQTSPPTGYYATAEAK